MPSEGGTPRQVGFHSAGYKPWKAGAHDGRSLLVSAARDHFWRDADRFFLIKTEDRSAEVPLFDTAGENGALSPDGKRLLFTREGAPWWRKGYRGSQDSQVWMADLESSHAFAQQLDPGGRSPLATLAGRRQGVLLRRPAQRARSTSASVTSRPARTGRSPNSRTTRVVVPLHLAGRLDDRLPPPVRLLSAPDGREPTGRRGSRFDQEGDVDARPDRAADLAGGHPGRVQQGRPGDRVHRRRRPLGDGHGILKEPKQITATPEEERDPIFSPKGDSVLFVSDQGGQSDLWKVGAGRSGQGLVAESRSFKLDRLTQDADVEADLKWSPDGSRVGVPQRPGRLLGDGPGRQGRLDAWSSRSKRTRFDWSPDGRWVVYAKSDDDFNEDIWIMPVDGSRAPFNLSRHPDNEGNPTWSPDGRMIAFTGRRGSTPRSTSITSISARTRTRSRAATGPWRRPIEKMKAQEEWRTTFEWPRSVAGRVPRPRARNPRPRVREPADAPAEEREEACPTRW